MRKLDFPRVTQNSYFSGVLPRQHALSLAQQVDHGMCKIGEFLCVCEEQLLSPSCLYGHKTEILYPGSKTPVYELKLSLGSVM